MAIEIPPDSTDRPPHPICQTCNVPMWMMRVHYRPELGHGQNRYHYQCKACDAEVVIPPLDDARVR